ASISASVVEACPGRRDRTARSARGLRPRMSTSPPRSRTSRGPRMRTFMTSRLYHRLDASVREALAGAGTVEEPRTEGDAMTRLPALLICCVAALVLAGVGGAANATSFTDRSGDAKLAPDIAALDVTNDDAGTLTFRLTFGGGLPPGLPGEDVGVALDLDQNPD